MTLEEHFKFLTLDNLVTLGDGTVVSIQKNGNLHVEHTHDGNHISYINTQFDGNITSEIIRAIVSLQRNAILEFFTECSYEALPDMD